MTASDKMLRRALLQAAAVGPTAAMPGGMPQARAGGSEAFPPHPSWRFVFVNHVIPAARRDDRYARGVGGAAARKIHKIPAARRDDRYACRVGGAAARKINKISAARHAEMRSVVRAAGITTKPFFVPTQYGIADACSLLGCEHQWTGSANSDVSEMVNAAIAAKAAASAVPIIDPKAFNAPVARDVGCGTDGHWPARIPKHMQRMTHQRRLT
jgi:ABC-type sugar transport system substrate-binding protein